MPGSKKIFSTRMMHTSRENFLSGENKKFYKENWFGSHDKKNLKIPQKILTIRAMDAYN